MRSPHHPASATRTRRRGVAQARRALALVALVALVVPACGGGEGHAAPQPDAPQAGCATLEEHLRGTLAAIEAGQTARLADALTAAAQNRGGADLQALLRTLLAVLGELWRQLQDTGATLPTQALTQALAGVEPALISVLRYLAQPDQTQRDTYDLVAGLVVECPPGALTDLVALLLGEPALIAALGATLGDPTVEAVVASLPDAQAGGLAALVRTLILAINNPTFVFRDLLDLIAPFFDLSQPPFDALLPPLERLLSGERLETVRALTRCLDQTLVVGSGRSGAEALGALLEGLILTEAVAIGPLLEGLAPALALLDSPDALGLLEALITLLQQDDEAREGLKPLVRFLMRHEHAPGVLGDAANLIEAGLVPELLGFLGDFLSPTCGAGAANATPAETP